MCHRIQALSGRLWRAAGMALGLTASWLPLPLLSAEVDFGRQVLPILSQHCFACHGPDQSQASSDLRLDSFAAATADLGAGQAIVPGKPDASLLMHRVRSRDPELRMPPAEAGPALTDQELATLAEWIAAGADYTSHWAYLPITSPPVPAGSSPPAHRSPIDNFIHSRLQAAGLTAAPPVDRRALLRRVTFDLTGLPPTWEEVLAFVNDPAEDAYARVIDRLLASPRYGERWGRHWLDIARYADTHGGGATGYTRFPFSYTYRDYVISAFNADLPYDQFVTQQIAADQLDLPAGHPALAAAGFLTIGRQYPSKHDVIDDRIDVVTRGLMGMTVACARCHDHKYDAIPTSDYYALYTTFASSQPPELLPELQLPLAAGDTDHRSAYDQELQRRTFRRSEMIREQSEVLRQRLRMQVGLYLRELVKGTPKQDLSVAFLSYRTDDYRPLVLERWRSYLGQLSAADPVFGPWHQLRAHRELPASEFAEQVAQLVATCRAENGDLSQVKYHALATQPPRWNPRVLQALADRQPQSMLEVADTYGQLLADVQQEWLTGLVAAAQEAAAGAEVVPDEDPAHASLNSSVNRQLRFHLHAPDSPTALSDAEASRLLNRPINDHVSGLGAAIEELHLNSPGSPPRAMLLAENQQPAAGRVFVRGDPLNPGPAVEARFLSALPGVSPSVFGDGQRRLDLARAVTDPANPLTRRVIVNWVWQRHFGEGLVRTPDDFGIRGQPPTHPELLDYLADTFLRLDQWSLKSLHRRLLLTDVYQQAAVERPDARQQDPENRLWWRMPRRRLDAEAMRDALLAVAGNVDWRMGGRPVDLFTQPFTSRRSVYGFVNRDVIAGFFSAFDLADPSVCAAQRPQTTVPQQTLYALNSEFIQSQAEQLTRLPEFASLTPPASRVRRLYQRILTRTPSDQEIDEALQFLAGQADAGAPAETAWQSLAHALMASNEFMFLD